MSRFLSGSWTRTVRNGRSPECTSGGAFHNALRRLQPRRQSVRPGFGPSRWNRCESSLLPFTFEAEPSVAVFAGDRDRVPEWTSAAVRGPAAIRLSLKAAGGAVRCPPVDLPSLSRCGGNQPHLPPLASRIEKRPITHRQVLRRGLCAKVCAHNLCFAGRVPEIPFSRRFCRLFSGKRTYQRVSSFLPASRWSKLSRVLNTRK
jgi:hypothetical protein